MHYSSYGRSKMSQEHSFFSRNSLANRGLVSNLSDLHTVSACRPGRFIFSNPRSQVSSMLNCESMYLYSRGSNLQCRHLRTQAPGNQGHHGKSWACEVRRDWTYADFFSIQRANVSMYLLLLWFPSSWDNDLVFKLNNVNALKVWWADRHTDRQTDRGRERERGRDVLSSCVLSPPFSTNHRRGVVTECVPFKGTFNVCWDKGVDSSFHLPLSWDSCIQDTDPFHTNHLVWRCNSPRPSGPKLWLHLQIHRMWAMQWRIIQYYRHCSTKKKNGHLIWWFHSSLTDKTNNRHLTDFTKKLCRSSCLYVQGLMLLHCCPKPVVYLSQWHTLSSYYLK